MIRRPARRASALCTAVVAALLLASCTPAPDTKALDGGPEPPSTHSGLATDPWTVPTETPNGTAGAGASGDPDAGSGSDSDGDGHTEEDTSGDGGNEYQVDIDGRPVTLFPASKVKNYLGQGTPPAGGTVQAPGISWGDKSPVQVTTLSLRQTRAALSKPNIATRYYSSPVDPDGNEELPPVDVIRLGHRTVVLTEGAVNESEEEEEGETAQVARKLRYSDGKTWKNGPTITDARSYASGRFSPPLVIGERMYWTHSEQDDVGRWTWVLQSWTPGENKPKTEASSKKLPRRFQSLGAATPRPMAEHRGRLFFGLTLDPNEGARNGSLVSMSLASGEVRLEAKKGSEPVSTDAGLVFSTTFDDLPYDYGVAPLHSLRLLGTPGASRALLTISRREAERGAVERNATINDEAEAPPSPLAGTPSLIGASKNTVSLAVRGQIVILKLSDKTGVRLLPAPKIWATPLSSPVQCGAVVAFQMQLQIPQGSGVAQSPALWVSYDSTHGTLEWRDMTGSQEPRGCDGAAFSSEGRTQQTDTTMTHRLLSVTLGGS